MVNTVNLNQSTPNSFLPILPIGIVAYALNAFVGQPLSKTAVYGDALTL